MIGLANRLGLAALVIGMVAASAGRASAGFTYNVSLSVPNSNGGNVTDVGTITVDMLGTITTGDITAYSIAIASPNNPTATLTSANSAFNESVGLTLSASATNLTISDTQSRLSGASFGLVSAFPSPNSLGSDFEFEFNDGLQTILTISNQPTAASPQDVGATFFSGSGPFVVGTAAPASVPEPSSLVLMGIAGLTGLGYAWRRRRAQVVA